jgi:hypothetical protein
MTPTDLEGRLVKYWCDRILMGTGAVPLTKLREVVIPEKLLKAVVSRVEGALSAEVDRICGNALFDFGSGGGGLREQLSEMLAPRVVITEGLMREIVAQVFRGVLDQWRDEPISLRQAIEDAEGFTAEVFRRATMVVGDGEGEAKEFPADLLAMVCDTSGLKALSEAVMLEPQISPGELTPEGFALLTRRLMMLKERYNVSRRLIAFEGTGKTIADALSAFPSPVAQPSPPVAAVAQASPPVQVQPTGAEVAPAAQAVTGAPRPGFDEAGNALYLALMSEDNLTYFSEVLFDKNTVAYQRLAYQIARQKKLANALTLADNELFVRQIPPQASPAMKLMTIIRQNFQGAEPPA